MASQKPQAPPAKNKLSPVEIGLIAVIVILVILIVSTLIGRALVQSGTLSTDPVERAHAVCLKTVYDELMADNQQVLAQLDAEKAELTKKAFKEMAESGCSVIKDECAKNRDGAVCTGLLEDYRAQK